MFCHPNVKSVTLVSVLVLAPLSGCPGSAKPIDLGALDDLKISDAPTTDVAKEATVEPDTKPPPPPPCSAEGVAQDCDPLTDNGCGEGAGCYVVPGTGAACVCPAGTTAAGDACNATLACAPMHVCFREEVTDTPLCHPTCDPAAPRCPDELPGCRQIEGYEQFGFCKNWPPSP